MPEPPLPEHELSIPDELLAWGKAPEQARRWPRPWAHEAAQVIAAGGDAPLAPKATQRLLARLEAVCAEAIRAGRGDLLLGMDLFTADWLGLVFEFEGPVQFGGRSGERWTYSELHALAATPEVLSDSGGRQFVEECKRFLAGAFPRARIGAIIDGQLAAPRVCDGCSGAGVALVELSTGGSYCSVCYGDLVTPGAAIPGVNAPRAKRTSR